MTACCISAARGKLSATWLSSMPAEAVFSTNIEVGKFRREITGQRFHCRLGGRACQVVRHYQLRSAQGEYSQSATSALGHQWSGETRTP